MHKIIKILFEVMMQIYFIAGQSEVDYWFVEEM